MDVDDIKMVGWTIIPNRGREVDIPAQIAFWLDEDSPYFKKMNSVAGSANGNDKIAMWYHDPECINIQYVLGPVVNNFTNVPDDAVKIEIAAQCRSQDTEEQNFSPFFLFHHIIIQISH